MDYHYSDPPKGYTPYYDSSPTSPYNDDYVYYAPQQYESPQVKRHKRKYSYTATIPREWYSPAGYPSPKHYEEVPDYKSPPYKEVYVSTIKRDMKSKLRSYSISGGRQNHTTRKQEQPIYIQMALMMHISTASQSQRRGTQRSPALIRTFNQEQIYDEQAKRSRGRRSSTTPRTPQKPSKPSYSKPPPKATEEDAARAGIPSGYSIKNWDPTESPIVLLGSVFDANSLGKWIYDWTVYHHGASTPMADVAGDLWLLLIKLAGKMKRAEECLPRIRSIDSQEMVEDFIESGSRLWQKFKHLLKACEQYMWRAARREGSKGVSMGKNAGTEFVDSIFGRDRELENTEKLMNSIRLWNMRFDANCEEILRRPSAA
jgi:hypothetical protein